MQALRKTDCRAWKRKERKEWGETEGWERGEEKVYFFAIHRPIMNGINKVSWKSWDGFKKNGHLDKVKGIHCLKLRAFERICISKLGLRGVLMEESVDHESLGVELLAEHIVHLYSDEVLNTGIYTFPQCLCWSLGNLLHRLGPRCLINILGWTSQRMSMSTSSSLMIEPRVVEAQGC